MSFPSSTGWRQRRNSGWQYRDIVDGAAAGWTCLEFYTRRFTHSCEQEWRQRLQAGRMRRRDEVIAADTVLAAGDRLTYHRAPWTEPAAPRWFAVLHEANGLLAVAKPAGLQVLPAAGFLQNTLLDVVRQRRGRDWAPAHRLGRGTTGLVLFASGAPVRRGVAAAFHDGRLVKVYRALVQGTDLADRFEVDAGIDAIPDPVMGSIHAAVECGGRPSRSLVRVVERRHETDVSLIDVEIPTGRPHQIRIHLALAGHPLVGEPLYGAGGKPRTGTVASAARPGDIGYHLHAMSLALTHPVTGDRITLYCQPPSLLRSVDAG
jgi:23S rRNA pseudouridine1911/1915/1917 synthase